MTSVTRVTRATWVTSRNRITKVPKMTTVT